MINPLYICGTSLRSGVLFISILYMLGSMGLMLFCLREYGMHSQYGDIRSREPHNKIDGDDEHLYKYLGVFSFINLFFYLLLWHGAAKKSRNRCIIWFSVSTFETSVLLVRILFYDIMYYRFEVGMFFFNLYNLWVVWAFIDEIFDEERNPLPQPTPRPLHSHQRRPSANPQPTDAHTFEAKSEKKIAPPVSCNFGDGLTNLPQVYTVIV